MPHKAKKKVGVSRIRVLERDHEEVVSDDDAHAEARADGDNDQLDVEVNGDEDANGDDGGDDDAKNDGDGDDFIPPDSDGEIDELRIRYLNNNASDLEKELAKKPQEFEGAELVVEMKKSYLKKNITLMNILINQGMYSAEYMKLRAEQVQTGAFISELCLPLGLNPDPRILDINAPAPPIVNLDLGVRNDPLRDDNPVVQQHNAPDPRISSSFDLYNRYYALNAPHDTSIRNHNGSDSVTAVKRIDADAAIKNFGENLKDMDVMKPVECLKNLQWNKTQFEFSNGKISLQQFAIMLVQRLIVGQHLFSNMKCNGKKIENADDFQDALLNYVFKRAEKDQLLDYVNRPALCLSRQALAEEVKTVLAIAPFVKVMLPGDIDDPTGVRIFGRMLPAAVFDALIEAFELRNSMLPANARFKQNFVTLLEFSDEFESCWKHISKNDKGYTKPSTSTTSSSKDGSKWCDRHGASTHITSDCKWKTDPERFAQFTCKICGLVGHSAERCHARLSWMNDKPASSSIKKIDVVAHKAEMERRANSKADIKSENKENNNLNSNFIISLFSIADSTKEPHNYTTDLNKAITISNNLLPEFSEHKVQFIQPSMISPVVVPVEIQSVFPCLEVSTLLDCGSALSYIDSEYVKLLGENAHVRNVNLQVLTVAGNTIISSSVDVVFQVGFDRFCYSFYVLPNLKARTKYDLLFGRDLISACKLDLNSIPVWFPRILRQDYVKEKVSSFTSHVMDEANQVYADETMDALEPFRTKVIFDEADSEEIIIARKNAYDIIRPAFDLIQPPPDSVINHPLAVFHATLKPGAEEIYHKQHHISDDLMVPTNAKVSKWIENKVLIPASEVVTEEHPVILSNSPIFCIVQKRDSAGKPTKYRLCYNAVALNEVLACPTFPAPDLLAIVEFLMKHRFYNSFDGTEFYTQFLNSPECRRFLGCKPPNSNLQMVFAKMIFGLAGAPGVAQRFSDYVCSLLWNTVCYIDNWFQAFNNISDCIPMAQAFMAVCKKLNIRINLDDMQLLATKMVGLGAVISFNKREVDPKRIEKLLNWPTIKSKEGLASFLASFVFFSQHIRYFSTIVAPLRELLKKGVKFIWDSTHSEAIRILRLAMVKLPPLKGFERGKCNHIRADASEAGGGWVHFQTDSPEDNVLTPYNVVMFYSFAFNSAQKAYNITQKEAYSIMHALLHKYDQLIGSPVYVSTDHQALTWLVKNATEGGTRTSRNWMHILLQFDLRIKWIPGIDNEFADSLSRMYVSSDWWGVSTPPVMAQTAVNALDVNESVVVNKVIEEKIVYMDDQVENEYEKVLQEPDNWTPDFKFATGLFFLDTVTIPSLSETFNLPTLDELETLLCPVQDLGEKSIVVRNVEPVVMETKLLSMDTVLSSEDLVVESGGENDFSTDENKLKCLQEIHKLQHMGPTKMLSVLSEREINFKNAYKFAKIVYDSCIPCIQNKKDMQKLMSYKKVASVSPGHTWHMDIGYFGNSIDSTGRNVLVVTDTMTHMIFAVVQSSKESNVVAGNLLLLTSILGIPFIIRSDNEPVFQSSDIKEFCAKYGIVHEFTTPYVHNQNRAERPIGILRPIVNAICQSLGVSWEDALYQAVLIVNSSQNISTKFNPFNVMFGRDSGLFRNINAVKMTRKNPETAVVEWLDHIQSHNQELLPRVINMENIRHDVRIEKLNRKMKRKVDTKIYPIGQIVFISKDVISGKSDVLYDGPFQISAIIDDIKYQLKDANNAILSRIYERSQLKIPAFYDSTIAEMNFGGTSVRYLDYIKSHRVKNGKYEYLVKWLGLDDTHNEYVYGSLVDTSAIIEYVSKLKGTRFAKTKISDRVYGDVVIEGLVQSNKVKRPLLKKGARLVKRKFGPLVPSVVKRSLRKPLLSSADSVNSLMTEGNVSLPQVTVGNNLLSDELERT